MISIAARNMRGANRTVPGRRWAACAALLLALLAGACSGIRERQAPAEPPEPEIPVDTGEFTLADNVNDIWNTVGQILVRLDGVEYESRAQMMGIYALRYRGERLLIRTQAIVIGGPTEGVLTRVLALGPDGKPIHSRAAIELLEVLEQRIPVEIGKYRTPVKLKKAAKPKKKKR